MAKGYSFDQSLNNVASARGSQSGDPLSWYNPQQSVPQAPALDLGTFLKDYYTPQSGRPEEEEPASSSAQKPASSSQSVDPGQIASIVSSLASAGGTGGGAAGTAGAAGATSAASIALPLAAILANAAWFMSAYNQGDKQEQQISGFLGGLGPGILGMTVRKSGKGEDQKKRDSVRRHFRSLNLYTGDKGANITLANGSTFDIGKEKWETGDGKKYIYNTWGLEDGTTQKVETLAKVIGYGLFGEDSKLASDAAAMLTNAAMSNAGGSYSRGRNNILSFLARMGVKPEEMRQRLQTLRNNGKIEEGLFNVLMQANDSLMPGKSQYTDETAAADAIPLNGATTPPGGTPLSSTTPVTAEQMAQAKPDDRQPQAPTAAPQTKMETITGSPLQTLGVPGNLANAIPLSRGPAEGSNMRPLQQMPVPSGNAIPAPRGPMEAPTAQPEAAPAGQQILSASGLGTDIAQLRDRATPMARAPQGMDETAISGNEMARPWVLPQNVSGPLAQRLQQAGLVNRIQPTSLPSPQPGIAEQMALLEKERQAAQAMQGVQQQVAPRMTPQMIPLQTQNINWQQLMQNARPA